jgi:BirA family biotin operon repressor/biotin-[acetyl-CoA-carboxylase] ligase
MLSQDSLERATRQAGIEAPPRFLLEAGSTNDVALELAGDGAPDWTVVAAGHQTSGRGRLGRSWVSAPGKALLFSVLLRPDLPPERSPLISLLAAERLAVACGPSVRTKWPNDLLIGGRKVAGILPEARLDGERVDHVVLGIGVNVGMEEDDFPPGIEATSLRGEGVARDPAGLLAGFLAGLRRGWRPRDRRFTVLVLGAYMARCDTIGRRVRASVAEGETVEGLATGMDPRGGLKVHADDGEHVVAFGEIVHLE